MVAIFDYDHTEREIELQLSPHTFFDEKFTAVKTPLTKTVKSPPEF
jgi:hypothetical protein